jgi:HAD superfamily hydrolase (TIGR01509 family)
VRSPGVDAVVFDWGGTLTPWHPVDLGQQWLAYAIVYDPDDATRLAERLYAAEEAGWVAAREQHVSGTLDDVLRRAGVEPSGDRHAAALAAYHEFWAPHTYIDPDVPPLLRALRERGIAVGVLSNTLWTREYHEEVFRRDEVLDLIDGAVYSSELPWTKPHPEAFHAALRAVGCSEPSRAVFVGDRPFDDIHGAQQVGMRTVLVPHSAIPDHQLGPVAGDPDGVVQRLRDLLPLVDGWR